MKSILAQCYRCYGRGYIIIHYRGGTIMAEHVPMVCSVCTGSGKININVKQAFEDYLGEQIDHA